jgi:gamma-polyglutamate biosynthesis protein CapA
MEPTKATHTLRPIYKGLVAVSVAFVFSGAVYEGKIPSFHAQAPVQVVEQTATTTPKTTKPISLLFVGDIMLGRHVEKKMLESGSEYPFHTLRDFLVAPDVTVGNFEGVIPEVHVPTQAFQMQFSIREEYMEALRGAGFDVLSLANNHSFDHGNTALTHTRALCASVGIVCGGAPSGIGTEGTKVVTVDDTQIGFIFIHTLYSTPSVADIERALETLSQSSDIQIAYVHWGEEYKLVHNTAQQSLAYALIDAGVDAVVGHHPHVVQDVALYKNAPIFYSLGNFVFDQFFSTDVQEGLVVDLEIDGDTRTFTLRGVSSIGTRSQPHFMDESREKVLFSRILAGVTDDIRVNQHEGRISLIP